MVGIFPAIYLDYFVSLMHLDDVSFTKFFQQHPVFLSPSLSEESSSSSSSSYSHSSDSSGSSSSKDRFGAYVGAHPSDVKSFDLFHYFPPKELSNSFCPPIFQSPLKIAFWNTRALFFNTSNPNVLRQKISYVSSLLNTHNVVLLQETHGSPALLDVYFREFSFRFFIDFSFLPQAAGGLVSFIKKDIIPNGTNIKPHVFEKGRIMRSFVTNGSTSLCVYNIHNSFVQRGSFSLFKASAIKDLDASNCVNFFTFLAGDINVAPHGKNDIDCLFPSNPTIERSNYDSNVQSWNTFFSNFTELALSEPTHDSGNGRLSFIDRCFYSFPVWAANLLNFDQDFFARAPTLSTLGLSDHAIVSICISSKVAHVSGTRPINKDLLKTPLFKSLIKTAVRLHPWGSFPLHLLLEELNCLIKEVADYTKERLHLLYDSCSWDSLGSLVKNDQQAASECVSAECSLSS